MSDLVVTVRQISNYPAINASSGLENVLVQQGGPGAPYASIPTANLVATALNDQGAMGIGMPLPEPPPAPGQLFAAGSVVFPAPGGGPLYNLYFDSADQLRYLSSGIGAAVAFENGTFVWQVAPAGGAGQLLASQDLTELLVLNVAGAMDLPNGTLSVARDPATPFEVATLNYISNNTVHSFNNRIGRVNLTATDVYNALQLDSPIATQAYVQQAIFTALTTGPIVATWNGRTGNVSLMLSDITCVFFQPGQQPIAPTPPPDSNDYSIATTQWVTAAVLGTPEVANILDYGAGVGGDDALAFRNAIASGKRVIYCPPGDYTFKSLTTIPGEATYGLNWQPTPCVLFNGVNNLTIIAYGATFRIDDAITYPDAARSGAGNAHCGFIGDCHHVTWRGGRFYGNTTHAGTAVNTGMWFQNVTQVLVEDTEWLGSYPNAPIFGGVWMFDCTFRNNRSYGSGNGHDHAWVENMTVENCVFDGNHAGGNAANTAYKLFTDPPTKTFNTPGSTLAPVTWANTGAIRNLVGGLSNSIRIIGNRWNGWANAVFIDGSYDVQIARNTIRNGWAATNGQTAPVYIATSDDTNALGLGNTRDVTITDNDIYDNLTSAFLLNPLTHGLGALDIRGNRIYDNTCPQAILFSNTTNIGTVRIEENDFTSRAGSSVQAAIIDQGQLNSVRLAGGNFSRNLGALPYMQTSNVMAITPGGAGCVSVSDGNNYYGMFLNGTGIALGPASATGTPASIWVALTAGLATFSDTHVLASGSQASYTVTDGSHPVGMFSNGTGMAFGPTAATGIPSAIWTSLDANGWKMSGSMSVWNATPPAAKPTVTGSKGANAALASLMTALASYGLVTDSTT